MKKDLTLWDEDYKNISYHRYIALQYENKGLLKEALKEYEQSIKLGHFSQFDMLHAYRFCYDRAIEISHKLGLINHERALLCSIAKRLILSDEKYRYMKRLNNLYQ